MISIKLGQRKLFFNELEFYNKCCHKLKNEKKITVIYAGAAAGIHSTLLAELFPKWKFHFYDMNPFSEDLKKYNNIHLYHQYFTNEDALYFASQNTDTFTIFLSDIRSGSDEDSVERDMEMQREWVEIMQPVFFFAKQKKGVC